MLNRFENNCLNIDEFTKLLFFLGIHAREWISPATATYILMELVENSNANDDILELYDVYILPVANPDGYVFLQITKNGTG